MTHKYTYLNLSRAGIPMHLVASNSKLPLIADIRAALSYALCITYEFPQTQVAHLLKISQSAVSQNIHKHHRLYNIDKKYMETYNNIMKILTNIDTNIDNN